MEGRTMASLDRIRTEGFRRWYERQLIECHAWLLSWFLALIVLISGIELVGGTGSERRSGAMLLAAGMLVMMYSWRRYRLMLEVAERLGEQAVCPGCQAYARFGVESSGPTPMPDGGDAALEKQGGGVWLRARCRKCGGEWMIK
jgi:hypothetical protein